MEELTDGNRGNWMERLAAFLLLPILFIPLIYVDGFVVDSVANRCPTETFLSGRVHNWNGWAIAFLGTAIWSLTGQAIGRLQKQPKSNRDQFFQVWGKKGLIAFAIFATTAAIAYWITSSSQFCLAADAIHYRQLPWQPFKRHSWSDIRKIAVECSNGFRSPDLYYTLIFKGGTELNIADAFPAPKKFPQFQAHLANVPFQFSPNIRPNCPEWYSNWVGQRP